MADKIKHPKKKRRPVKKPPAISVFDTVVTREQWESWLKNQLRRESVILRKASVKTAATKDELENLMRKDAFLTAYHSHHALLLLLFLIARPLFCCFSFFLTHVFVFELKS